MPTRPIRLPSDLSTIADLALASFQYPENPSWSVQQDEKEGLIDSIINLQRIWPLVALVQAISPALRHILTGFLWEEGGKPAGLSLCQRRGTSNNWIISTVATLPQFRRRGIARRLVQASLEMIRANGGRTVILDVIAGNLPAYRLYQQLGFEHFSSKSELTYTPNDHLTPPALPEGFAWASLNTTDWRQRYQLEKAASPENVLKYEPVDEARFRPPFLLRLIYPLILRAQGQREQQIAIRPSDQQHIVAHLRIAARTRAGGIHTLTMRLLPTKAELAPLLIRQGLYTLHAIDTEHRIETAIPQWQAPLVDAAHAIGFSTRIEYHRMGLVL